MRWNKICFANAKPESASPQRSNAQTGSLIPGALGSDLSLPGKTDCFFNRRCIDPVPGITFIRGDLSELVAGDRP
jgi:hypothetical protein